MDDVQLEHEGFEALQRLYALAVDYGDDWAPIVARFLLGLYNGNRFPFDLTDLRELNGPTLEDCFLVLRMDACLTRREVHGYFDQGGAKFEALVQAFGVNDVERLKATGDGSPRPVPTRGTLASGDTVAAGLVTCGDAPGYRDVYLIFDCSLIGDGARAVGPVRLELSISPKDGEAIARHVREVHRFAWRTDRGPLDARPGEKRPMWLDDPDR